MAFTSANSTAEARSFSLGPVKLQIITWSAGAADTTGTFTADQLIRATQAFVDGGLLLTAPTTYSGKTATITFAAPGVTVYGTALILGA